MTLKDIERMTGEYADAHNLLSSALTEMNEEMAAVKKRHLGKLKRLVNTAAARKAVLHTAVAGAPDLFARPRTHVFAGIKVGMGKSKGSLKFDDADAVVSRIEKMYDEQQAELLIRTTKAPDKAALEGLSAAELTRLGCEITGAGDRVVIKPAAGDVEKIVEALLKDAVDAAVEKEAA